MVNQTENLTSKSLKKKGWLIIASLILALFFVSLIFHIFRLDPKFSALFFDADLGWMHGKKQPWLWLFEWGTLPGIFLTLASLVGWFLSYFIEQIRSYRRYFLLVFLTAIIGGGIIVNGLLKDYWGRPRPTQTIEFNGLWDYRQVCEPGTPGRGKSFPCGHCTMGYLFTILLFFRRKNKWIAYLGGGFGVVYGIMISAARILQGGHFLQDTIWSLGILWLTAVTLHYFIIKAEETKDEKLFEGSFSKKMTFGMVIAIALTLIVGTVMTRRPYFRSYNHQIKVRKATKQLTIKSNFEWKMGRIIWHNNGKKAYVKVDAKGFGLPNVIHHFYTTHLWTPTTGEIHFEIHTNGYFSELHHTATLHLPLRYKKSLTIKVEPNASLPALTVKKHSPVLSPKKKSNKKLLVDASLLEARKIKRLLAAEQRQTRKKNRIERHIRRAQKLKAEKSRALLKESNP
ncbi:MAG: phosphatase PAP2 family protein [SAR324 cluster bacterium]|nr:phosphatase PAP2 family protein [SAR324 cluster bacterium]